jgi:hypothetical protein
LGCHGQQAKTPIEKKQRGKDSVAAILDEPMAIEGIPSKKVVEDQVNAIDTIAVKKVKRNVPKTTEVKVPDAQQTKTVSIWTDEQIVFLNQVEKILLFNVRVTDIGSRKLELDSQLDSNDHEAFVQILLHPDSYPDTALTEASNGKKFEPDYQLLFEAGDEKLTLMFDVEGLNMMVANLYGREKHAITQSLMEHVENLKKK